MRRCFVWPTSPRAALTPGPSPGERGETEEPADLTPGPSPGTDRRLVGRGETDERAALTPGPSPKGRGSPAPPPVKITVGPDGRLIVSSEDGVALDQLEELAAQLATPRKDYRIFHLKYAWAVGVAEPRGLLQRGEKRTPPLDALVVRDVSSSQDDSSSDRRLSKRRKLRLISDADSNTILVEGASRTTKTIEELVQVYDQPPPSDSQSIRKTEVIRLKYSKAKAVADTVKDVYRDLLSANDKALAGNGQGRGQGRTVVFNYGDSDRAEQKTPKFKGLLSIGVDEISNSLTISAPAYLFEHVTKLIKELDEAAVPDYTIRLVHVPGMSAARLKEALNGVYMQKSGEKPSGEERPVAKKATPPKPSNSALRNRREGPSETEESR